MEEENGKEQGHSSSSSQDNLGDSTLRDDAHPLDSSNPSLTTTEDSDHRHAPPDSSCLSNSSTPIRNSPTQYGSNSESATWGGGDHLELDSSPISKPKAEDDISGTAASEEQPRGETTGGGKGDGRLDFDGTDSSNSSDAGSEKESESSNSSKENGIEGSLNSSASDPGAKTAEVCGSAESVRSNSSSVAGNEDDSDSRSSETSSETDQVVPSSTCTADNASRDSHVPESTVGLATESVTVDEQRENQHSEDAGPAPDCSSANVKSDGTLSSSSSPSPAMSNSPTVADGGDQVPQLPSIKAAIAADGRLRSSSAGAATRRVSVESGLSPRQREAVMSEMSEGKKRRWSLDRPHIYNNLPQVSWHVSG